MGFKIPEFERAKSFPRSRCIVFLSLLHLDARESRVMGSPSHFFLMMLYFKLLQRERGCAFFLRCETV